MRFALKRLQPSQPLVPQPVLGQHAAHRFPQHLAAAELLHQHVHGDALERARPRVVSVVRLAELLLAGCVERRAVGHDHVVAAVGGGVPDGLVFAH